MQGRFGGCEGTTAAALPWEERAATFHDTLGIDFCPKKVQENNLHDGEDGLGGAFASGPKGCILSDTFFTLSLFVVCRS